MKYAFNIFLFALIALLALQNQLILAAVGVLIFTYRCGAVWLLPLAFFIDGYFGMFAQLPLFSIGACTWYVVSELLRPRLVWQYKKV